MNLWLLLSVPFLFAPFAWWAERWSRSAPRWIALGAILSDVVLALRQWIHAYASVVPNPERWLLETRVSWIPQWGIDFHLGMDGLSLVLILLTTALGLVAVVASWTDIRERIGFFHFNLLLVLSGVIGVFLALDLFLFFLFWEVMLLPMYLLIAVWGHEHRRHAAVKFFLFTQAGSLILLASIVSLALLHQRMTGEPSFEYEDLLRLTIPPDIAWWLMIGFVIGFGVKLPIVSFHAWLPDAYTEAPTGASIILAGVLQKPAAYGLLRFLLPLFPEPVQDAAPVMMGLGALSILYGTIMACAQSDLKRLLGYSSMGHLGFALLGVFASTELGIQGTVILLIAHGVSTGALFMLAGALEERFHTRDMRRLGGLWDLIPRLASLSLFFAIASLGVPGLGNFIGEFLVLLGAYGTQPVTTAVAATGIITAALYALALVHRTFFGDQQSQQAVPDISNAAFAVLLVMVLVQLGLGWYPKMIFATTAPVTRSLLRTDVDAALLEFEPSADPDQLTRSLSGSNSPR